MKRTPILSTILILCISQINLTAQNLVSNPGFEQVVSGYDCTHSPTPSTFSISQQDLENYWNQITSWMPPRNNAPCITGGAASADVLCQTGAAHSGNNYGWGVDREYICAQLNGTIVKNKIYSFEFYVKGFNGGNIEDAGIKFYTERPKQCAYDKLRPNKNTPPQIKIVNISKDGAWHKVSGNWIADNNYSWITLGTFSDDIDQSVFWDDIVIKEFVPGAGGQGTAEIDYCYQNKPVVGNFNADLELRLYKKEKWPGTVEKKMADPIEKKMENKSLKFETLTINAFTGFVRKNYPDIVYYGKCGQGSDCWRTHLNDKNENFTETSYGENMWFQGNKPIHAPVAGDFNRDGYTDIAYYGKCGSGNDCWRVHLNDKNGSFTVTSYGGDMWFQGDKPINAPVAGDFNRDGYADIAYYGKCGSGSDCWRVHLNDKNGNFTPASYGGDMWFQGDKPINAPIAGDFNRDRYTDIAYFGKCGTGNNCWRVHLNDKNGNFTTTSYGGGMWFQGDKPINAPLAGDFNRDGYTDIAYYGKCGSGNGCWRVHLNDKNGSFTVTSYGGDMWFQGNEAKNTPVAGDFNRDGYTDIAYYGKCGTGSDCWRVHLNDKNGNFIETSYGGDMWFHNCE